VQLYLKHRFPLEKLALTPAITITMTLTITLTLTLTLTSTCLLQVRDSRPATPASAARKERGGGGAAVVRVIGLPRANNVSIMLTQVIVVWCGGGVLSECFQYQLVCITNGMKRFG
jgi:hypothetical protein